MSTDHDIARSLRSWLREDRHEDADRVLDAVLTEVDATPQRHASWLARRIPLMKNTLRLALVAAAVLAIALLGINLLPDSDTGAPQPTPIPTPTPTPIASPTPTPGLPLITRGDLDPGEYLVTLPTVDQQFVMRVPAGWAGTFGDTILKGDAVPPAGMAVEIYSPSLVYRDPCNRIDPVPALGPGVDDLVAAIAAIDGTEATVPVEAQMAGHAATYLELTVDDDIGCVPSQFYLWRDSQGGTRWAQATGEFDRIWVFDVSGTRVMVVATSFAGTSEEDLAEQQAIVDSIRVATE